MDAWLWFVVAAAVIGLILLVRWLLKWQDPDWTEEDENRSELWSKRAGSGGIGS